MSLRGGGVGRILSRGADGTYVVRTDGADLPGLDARRFSPCTVHSFLRLQKRLAAELRVFAAHHAQVQRTLDWPSSVAVPSFPILGPFFVKLSECGTLAVASRSDATAIFARLRPRHRGAADEAVLVSDRGWTRVEETSNWTFALAGGQTWVYSGAQPHFHLSFPEMEALLTDPGAVALNAQRLCDSPTRGGAQQYFTEDGFLLNKTSESHVVSFLWSAPEFRIGVRALCMPHRLMFLARAEVLRPSLPRRRQYRRIVLFGAATYDGRNVRVRATREDHSLALLEDGRVVECDDRLALTPKTFVSTQVIVAYALSRAVERASLPGTDECARARAVARARDGVLGLVEEEASDAIIRHAEDVAIDHGLVDSIISDPVAFNAFMANFEALAIAVALVNGPDARIQLDAVEPVVTVRDDFVALSVSVAAFHADPACAQEAIVRVETRAAVATTEDVGVDADRNMHELVAEERESAARAEARRARRRAKKQQRKKEDKRSCDLWASEMARDDEVDARESGDAKPTLRELAPPSDGCASPTPPPVARGVCDDLGALSDDLARLRADIDDAQGLAADREALVARLRADIDDAQGLAADREALVARLRADIDDAQGLAADREALVARLRASATSAEDAARLERAAHAESLAARDARIEAAFDGTVDLLVRQLLVYARQRQLMLDDGHLSVQAILCNGYAAMNIVRILRLIDPRIGSEAEVFAAATRHRPDALRMPDSGRLQVLAGVL